MDATIDMDELADALQTELDAYGDQVFKATDESLVAGANVLIEKLKAASPSKTGKFKRNWTVIKKYKLKKYVGNTTTVKGPSGEVPLANILEYSEVRGKPFIRNTFDSAVDAIAAAIINGIKKGV